MLISEAMQEFIYECGVKKYTPKTVKGYRNNIQAMIAFFENTLSITVLADIKPSTIKKYFMYLYGKHCKESYVNGILKTIRSFFKYCVSEEYINENPTLKVSWAKEEKSVIATFTNEEVIKMIDFYNCDSYAGARNKTILAMLFDTGIRNSELCGLLKSDVQSENLRIKGKGKKGTYQ